MQFFHLISITFGKIENESNSILACDPNGQDAIGCDKTDCMCTKCDISNYRNSCDYDSCYIDICTVFNQDLMPCATRDHCYVDYTPCDNHDDCIYDNECGTTDTENQPCPPVG